MADRLPPGYDSAIDHRPAWAEDSRPPGYRARHAGAPAGFSDPLWRHGDFLKLWSGQTVSMLGSRVTELSLPLTALLLLDASPAELGYLNVAEYLPVTLVTLFAGVVADRMRRRPILILTNLGRAAILAVVPVLALTGALSMAVLYAVAFCTGILTSQFDVAYQAYLPVLVKKDDLGRANSKLQATRSIAETGGHGLGGVLIQLLTAPGAIIVDCLSYLVSALALARIRFNEPPMEADAARRNVWAEIREGLGVTLGNRILRAILFQSAWFNLLADVVLVVFPLYAVRDLRLTPAGLGLVIAAGSVGAFLGALVARPLARRAGMGPAMAVGMGLASCALVLIPLADGPRPVQISMLVAGYVLSGVGIAIFNIHSVTFRQTVVPTRLIGRVSATYRFIAWAVIPVGGLIGGALAARFGARNALLITAIGLALGAVVFAFTKAGRTRQAPDEQDLIEGGQAAPPGVAARPVPVHAARPAPVHAARPVPDFAPPPAPRPAGVEVRVVPHVPAAARPLYTPPPPPAAEFSWFAAGRFANASDDTIELQRIIG